MLEDIAPCTSRLPQGFVSAKEKLLPCSDRWRLGKGREEHFPNQKNVIPDHGFLPHVRGASQCTYKTISLSPLLDLLLFFRQFNLE